MQLVTLVDYFGTVVFAFSGALAGGHKRMDVFGVAMVGLVTAVGGGSLRDVLIGALPVFWVQQPVYLLVAMLGVVLALALFGLLERSQSQHHLAHHPPQWIAPPALLPRRLGWIPLRLARRQPPHDHRRLRRQRL